LLTFRQKDETKHVFLLHYSDLRLLADANDHSIAIGPVSIPGKPCCNGSRA